MNEERHSVENPKSGPTWFHYTVGALSFIPLIGVLNGIVVIVWGLRNRRSGGLRLVWIGAAGICTTVVLYGSLAFMDYYTRKTGFFDAAYTDIAKKHLNTTVALIEQYKTRNGRYPARLEDMVTGNVAGTVFNDPFPDIKERGWVYLYYNQTNGGTNYYLLSVGPDGIPFTPDDVVPDISTEDRARWGILTSGR